MKTILILLAGFLLHKAVFEVVEIRHTINYKACIPKSDMSESKWIQCKKNLDNNIVEDVLLYQLNIWEYIDWISVDDFFHK